MDNQPNIADQLQEIIGKNTSGSILLPQNPSSDAVFAALALASGLTKIGKSSSIASGAPVQLDITGTDTITQTLMSGGDNLVISFPYQDGAIDKVDYFIKDTQFNLVVTPRQGFPKLDASRVQYSYSGSTADFFVVLDAPNLNSLGTLYKDNQKLFVGKPIINIDRHLVNDMYGTVNIVDKTSSSTSQLVFRILSFLQVEIDKEMATNLYNGLLSATNNFTAYSVNAETFDTAAQLMKYGAAKRPARPQNEQTTRPPMPQQDRPMNQQQSPMPSQPAFQDEEEDFTPPPPPLPRRQAPPPSVPEPQYEEPQPIDDSQQSDEQTPQDWLKPKIFRGGGGLV